MKKNLLLLLSSALLASNLSAAETATTTPSEVKVTTSAKTNAINTGWYIGLGLGASAYSDGDMGKDFATEKFVVDDNTATGVKLYAGYKFNSIVAVEATFIQYGTYSFKNEKGSDTITTEIKPRTLNVVANLGYDFLNDQLRPFALVGLGVVNFNQSGNLDVYSKDNGAALVVGVGLEYTPTIFHGIGFRATLENTTTYTILDFSDDPSKDDKAYANPLGLFTLGVNYKF